MRAPKPCQPCHEPLTVPIDLARNHSHIPKRELADHEIVAAVRRGDASVARVLYDRLRPAIDFTLRRLLRGQGIDTDDLTQVTFERVIRAIAADRFSGKSALSTWAAAIAGHVAIDFLRRSRLERRLFGGLVPLEVSDRPSGAYSTERCLEARSELQRIQGVLARMSPILVETVVLHDVLGHSIEEVAACTGVSESAAASRLRRGRKELVRRALGGKPAT